MKKWYAVQVRTGNEEATAQQCRRVIAAEVLEEYFLPRYERMRRYQGAWHKEEHLMFPGYLFLITDKVEDVFCQLRQVPKLTKILGDGNEFIPLRDAEVEFLKHIGNEKHLTEMSVGYITGDQVIITDGPMKTLKGTIRRIDRHKRIAVVEVQMFGRLQDVTLGVEIVRKVKEDGNL